jgi:hypothetical protein
VGQTPTPSLEVAAGIAEPPLTAANTPSGTPPALQAS